MHCNNQHLQTDSRLLNARHGFGNRRITGVTHQMEKEIQSRDSLRRGGGTKAMEGDEKHTVGRRWRLRRRWRPVAPRCARTGMWREWRGVGRGVRRTWWWDWGCCIRQSLTAFGEDGEGGRSRGGCRNRHRSRLRPPTTRDAEKVAAARVGEREKGF
jgi:hypothetical protein